MSASMNIANWWLLCRVDQGMFSDEVAVTYPAEGDAIRSVFVPRSETGQWPKNKSLKAVRVRIIRPERDKPVAVLPSDESTLVAVQERDLAEVS
ncbi:MAG: hypothetical protein ACP5O7_10620 [Phycisphaerae bacterium]